MPQARHKCAGLSPRHARISASQAETSRVVLHSMRAFGERQFWLTSDVAGSSMQLLRVLDSPNLRTRLRTRSGSLGGEQMQNADGFVSGFDRDAYEEIIGEVSDISTRLPQRTLELVSREVVARLKARYERLNPADHNVGEADIETLCIALISDDHQETSRFIAGLYEKGVLLQSIYLGYLAGAAARLGEWWETDRVTLADVHLAAGRILVIMKSLRRAQSHSTTDLARQATFALVPGEQHSVGLNMAAELYRRTGWLVSVLHEQTHERLLPEIEREDCAFVGLSASGPRSHQALARLIAALRVWKPDLFIVIGGQLAERFPRMVGRLGPNALAADPLQAINRMEEAIRGDSHVSTLAACADPVPSHCFNTSHGGFQRQPA